MKTFAVIALVGFVAMMSGCSSTSKTTPQPTNSNLESRTPCPLVTDADLAKLNPVLKRAGDEWQERNGSIYCGISFGVDLTTISGNNTKPFELLEISVMRSSDFPKEGRLSKDLCTDPVNAHIGECIRLKGVGDYAFYIKTLGKVYRFKGVGYWEMPHEAVRAISGPYEIIVDAGYWKGGSPRQGVIDLAKKLTTQYH